jgi:hypothetical protein
VGRLAGVSAQKVATAVGLVAFVALVLGVGAPALLPPGDVPAIQIVVPAGETTDHGDDNEANPATTAPSGGDDDDADDRTTDRGPTGGQPDDGPAGGDDDDDDDGDDD